MATSGPASAVRSTVVVRIHATTQGCAGRGPPHERYGRPSGLQGVRASRSGVAILASATRRGYLAMVVVLVTGFVFVTQVVTVFVTVFGLVVVVVR